MQIMSTISNSQTYNQQPEGWPEGRTSCIPSHSSATTCCVYHTNICVKIPPFQHSSTVYDLVEILVHQYAEVYTLYIASYCTNGTSLYQEYKLVPQYGLALCHVRFLVSPPPTRVYKLAMKNLKTNELDRFQQLWILYGFFSLGGRRHKLRKLFFHHHNYIKI